MKIKNKLRISTIFSLFTALAAGCALFFLSKDVRVAIERNKAADEVVKGVFELDTLTYEYLLNHEERMQAQWRLRHDSLTELFRKMKLETPGQRVTGDEIRQKHEGVKILFAGLVAKYEKEREDWTSWTKEILKK